jgi:hypothetical protein
MTSIGRLAAASIVAITVAILPTRKLGIPVWRFGGA